MTGAALILERAAYLARSGERNPHLAIIRASDGCGEEGSADALIAILKVLSPVTLTGWQHAQRRTLEEAAALLEEALFQLQLHS